MLPVEDALYVSFEWIGNENSQGERAHGEGTRTRGANFTSTDAVVMFENLEGQKQVVLVEWKYTESYPEITLVSRKVELTAGKSINTFSKIMTA